MGRDGGGQSGLGDDWLMDRRGPQKPTTHLPSAQRAAEGRSAGGRLLIFERIRRIASGRF